MNHKFLPISYPKSTVYMSTSRGKSCPLHQVRMQRCFANQQCKAESAERAGGGVSQHRELTQDAGVHIRCENKHHQSFPEPNHVPSVPIFNQYKTTLSVRIGGNLCTETMKLSKPQMSGMMKR